MYVHMGSMSTRSIVHSGCVCVRCVEYLRRMRKNGLPNQFVAGVRAQAVCVESVRDSRWWCAEMREQLTRKRV